MIEVSHRLVLSRCNGIVMELNLELNWAKELHWWLISSDPPDKKTSVVTPTKIKIAT